jgi:asparagine synthase (glutamine-hydrolysing)
MCGYIGTISPKQINKKQVLNSNKRIECRGPDAQKFLDFKINNHNCSFIFNRLAIVDLSITANQPMESHSGSSIIMFNGEIYNHESLRAKLNQSGEVFKTKNSDTEVLLNGLDHFGMQFISELRGQFSIVYLNKKLKKLYLIRDRVGQKPLFYSLNDESISFSSNLISTAEISDNFNINSKSVEEYLECGVVTSPNTIFNNVYSLLPGEIIEFDLSGTIVNTKKMKYWDPENFLGEKKFENEEFLSIFSDSVKIRTKADVDVANFISGGIDSSAIAKNLHDNNISINSFSVGLNNSIYDESVWSQEVAKAYKTEHTQVDIDVDISFEQVLIILSRIDEPYADPSVVPSYILSKAIAEKFKVAISGDGGDELLGGYLRISNTLKNKSSAKNFLSHIYKLYPPFLGTGSNFLSNSKNIGKSYSSYLYDEKFINLLGRESNKKIFEKKINSSNMSDYKKLIYSEFKFFLPEMMMLKVDRTSMANSLEVRSPFVDHKLIEYIFSHDNSYYDNTKSKAILKSYLSSDFSDSFLNRKKMGFVFDIQKFIFSNLFEINEFLSGGYVENQYKNVINKLSVNKSRINSIRIWRILVLENFIQQRRF